MDTALRQKFPFSLDRNLAKANCTEDRVCTSCDTVVLGSYEKKVTVQCSKKMFYVPNIQFLPTFLLFILFHLYNIYVYIYVCVNSIICIYSLFTFYSLHSG